MRRHRRHPSLLDEYCTQLAHLLERQQTECVLIAAKEQAEYAARLARDSMRTARAADHAKTLFLGTITHELRTPLNAILGFSELLQRPLGQSAVADYAAHIREAGMLLLGMLDNALELARIEAGDLQLDEREVLLDDVLDIAVRPLCKAIEDKSVTLSRGTKLDRPLWIDAEKIARALTNILSNAISSVQPNGQIAIDAKLSGTGGLLMIVSDNGIGIGRDEIERVLRPFGQTKMQHHGGVGLRLPIARALIRMHDGELALSSKIGKGTTIKVTLPPERVLQPSAAGDGAAGAIPVRDDPAIAGSVG